MLTRPHEEDSAILSQVNECLIKAAQNSALAENATTDQWRTFYRKMENAWRDLATRYTSSTLASEVNTPTA